MRRETSIPSLVYNHLFPNPQPTDPPDFQTHLAKHLVAEVRIETQRFYGGLETVEARYPGLNYSHPPHRKRLGRFPHHARLFRAFDELGLTEYEISMLCRWEGTLWARQRYERDEGIKVVDTTGMEIGPWVDRRRVQKRGRRSSPRGIKVKTHIEVEIEEVGIAAAVGEARTRSSTPIPQTQAHANVNHPSSYPVPQHSIMESARIMTDSAHPSRQSTPTPESNSLAPTALHLAQLRALATAASLPRGLSAHGADLNLEAAWEQYLKEQAERGELSITPAELAAGIRNAALTAAMQNGGPTSSASTTQAAPPDSMTQRPSTATASETTA